MIKDWEKEMSKYIVYTEIHHEHGSPENEHPERWYYGTYDYTKANEVALELGGKWPIYHCVCEEELAKYLGIQNMPKNENI